MEANFGRQVPAEKGNDRPSSSITCDDEPRNPNPESSPSTRVDIGQQVPTEKGSDPPVTCVDEDEPRNPNPGSFPSPRVTESKKEEVVGAPQTPKWLLDEIKKDKGNEPTLIVAEKVLFSSDLNKNLARLMFPSSKVLTREFLREEEKETLNQNQTDTNRKQGVDAVFIDPDSNRHEVTLKQWTNNTLVLSTGWNLVLKKYKFEEDQKFPLWSFRSERGKLCFALVPKKKDNGDDFKDPVNVNDFPDENEDRFEDLSSTFYYGYFVDDFSHGYVNALPDENEDRFEDLGSTFYYDYFLDDFSHGYVSALPDMGSFEDTDVVASYFEDA